MPCVSHRLTMTRGCLFRFSFRLSMALTQEQIDDLLTGSVIAVKLWGTEDRSGFPVRQISTSGNPTQFDYNATDRRYYCTFTAQDVDELPALEIGSILRAAIEATWGGETDPQRIAEFEVEVRG